MKTRAPIQALAALAGLALFTAPANADVINPTTATVVVGGSTNTNITNTINGAGQPPFPLPEPGRWRYSHRG